MLFKHVEASYEVKKRVRSNSKRFFSFLSPFVLFFWSLHTITLIQKNRFKENEVPLFMYFVILSYLADHYKVNGRGVVLKIFKI